MEKRFVLCPNMGCGVWLTEENLEIIEREFSENGPFGPEIKIEFDEENMETTRFFLGLDEFYSSDDTRSRAHVLLEHIFMLGYNTAKRMENEA